GGAVTTLDTGTGSASVNVQATTGALVISEQGSGKDTIILSPTARNLNDIKSFVTVNGNSGSGTMIVDDQNGPARSWDISSGNVAVSGGGPPSILYNGLRNLVLNGSNGANTYAVVNTDSFFTTLNTGNGNDLVNVQSTAGSLTVNAGAGDDTTNVGSSGTTLDDLQG